MRPFWEQTIHRSPLYRVDLILFSISHPFPEISFCFWLPSFCTVVRRPAWSRLRKVAATFGSGPSSRGSRLADLGSGWAGFRLVCLWNQNSRLAAVARGGRCRGIGAKKFLFPIIAKTASFATAFGADPNQIFPQVSTQRWIYQMSLSRKRFSAIALAIALAPLAAQAKTAPRPAHGEHQTVVVHSGAASFRDSFGG
jgi:hypothetical protein